MDSVDLYCERVGAGFWAEPVNALTSIVVVFAAWGAWHTLRRSSTLSPGVWLLLASAVAIGIGSFVFHTVATSWARLLDVLPILAFQLSFLWLYARRVMGLRRSISGLLLVGFLAATNLGRQLPTILNGSLLYVPALLAIFALGIYHARTAAIGRFDLLAAAAVLAVSFFFRVIDNSVCPTFPIGTHFLWHVLNGAILYLAMRPLVHQRPR